MTRKQEIAAVLICTIAGIVCCAFTGCNTFSDPNATAAQLEAARVAAASVFAFAAPSDSPTPPAPEPDRPSPSGQCERCQGSGKIKPDGRIQIDCPDCDGTGRRAEGIERKLSALSSQLSALGSSLDTFGTKLDSNHKQLFTLVATSRTQQPATKPAAPAAIYAGAVWLDELNEAKRTAASEQKPALIHWYTDNCQPCAVMDAQVFSDRQVTELIADSFVAARIHAGRVSHKTRTDWQSTRVPVDQVITADFRKMRTLQRTADPENYAAQLAAALKWAVDATGPVSETTTNTVTSHVCHCGPNCRCVGECFCQWPGQCFGAPNPPAAYNSYEIEMIQGNGPVYYEQPMFYRAPSMPMSMPRRMPMNTFFRGGGNCVGGVCW